jgi:hypothetical protein
MTTQQKLMLVATACEAILAIQIAAAKGNPPPSEWFILNALAGLSDVKSDLEAELSNQ